MVWDSLTGLFAEMDGYLESRDVPALLIDSEYVCSIIADTNADDWSVDDIVVTGAAFKEGGAVLRVEFEWSASGEQKPDRMFAGTSAHGTAVALIAAEDGTALVDEDFITGDIDEPADGDIDEPVSGEGEGGVANGSSCRQQPDLPR